MSVFINWIWPEETDDEKIARWQALYEFDYSSKNNWKRVKEDNEDEFISHFTTKWAGETISMNVNTAGTLKANKIWIGRDNEKYEKLRLAILTAGFKAFQYGQLFT